MPPRNKVWLHDNLLDQDESVWVLRVWPSWAGVKAEMGYRRRPSHHGSKPSIVVNNTLGRQFDVAAPDRPWATEITIPSGEASSPAWTGPLSHGPTVNIQ